MSAAGGNLRIGIGAAIIFPILMGAGIFMTRKDN